MKILKRFLLNFFLFLFCIVAVNKAYSQASCYVNALANNLPDTIEICYGDTVVLMADGNCPNYLLYNDFNDSTAGSGWQATNQAMFTNPCPPHSPDSTIYMWMGSTSTAPRILTTVPFDVSMGCDISWEMRYAVQSVPSPCEGPDRYHEGVSLQYSTNGGATWVDIVYFAPNGDILTTTPTQTTPGIGAHTQTIFTVWDTYTYAIPPAAQTTSTMFRWAQLVATSAIYDHWGLDNVIIGCPPPNIEIWWEHGAQGAGPHEEVPASTTTYTAYVTDQIDTVQSNVTVIVHQPPTMSIDNLAALHCVDGPPSTMSGTPAGGVFSGSGVSGNTFYPDVAGVGTHTVTYTYAVLCVNLDTLCVFSVDATTEVVDAPNALFSMPDTVCINESITINYTGTAGATATYNWGFDGGTIISGANAGPYEVSWNTPGTKTASLIVTENGCDSPINEEVIAVQPLPNITIAVSDEICDQVNGSLTASGGDTYLWSNGQAGETISGLSAGTYYVTVSDAHCTNTESATIVNLPGPIASFMVNASSQSVLDDGFIFTDMSVGATSWHWDFGDTHTSIAQNPIHSYNNPGTYTVTLNVRDNNECEDQTKQELTVRDLYTIYVPSAFTPDGDGINDLFGPMGIGLDNDYYEMSIFDRWGKMIFYTEDINNHWDGTVANSPSGEKIPGVYTYRIYYKIRDGREQTIEGTVTLILP